MTFVSDSTAAEQLPVGMVRCIKCHDIIDPRYITSHNSRDCKARHADYIEDEILNLHNKNFESKSTY